MVSSRNLAYHKMKREDPSEDDHEVLEDGCHVHYIFWIPMECVRYGISLGLKAEDFTSRRGAVTRERPILIFGVVWSILLIAVLLRRAVRPLHCKFDHVLLVLPLAYFSLCLYLPNLATSWGILSERFKFMCELFQWMWLSSSNQKSGALGEGRYAS